MAGGIHAVTVACLECLYEHGVITKATRVREGREADQYICVRRHSFGIDWSSGPATEPQWPPPPELVALAKPRESN